MAPYNPYSNDQNNESDFSGFPNNIDPLDHSLVDNILNMFTGSMSGVKTKKQKAMSFKQFNIKYFVDHRAQDKTTVIHLNLRNVPGIGASQITKLEVQSKNRKTLIVSFKYKDFLISDQILLNNPISNKTKIRKYETLNQVLKIHFFES